MKAYKLFITAVLFAALTALLPAQQPDSQTAAPAEDNSVPVNQLGQDEPDSPMQRMLRTFAELQLQHNSNLALLDELQKARQALRMQAADTEKLLASALLLQQACRRFANEIDAERAKQVDFKADIDQYSANHRLLRQEASYLSHHLDELRRFGIEQEKAMVQQQQILREVGNFIRTAPPPEEFVNHAGIKMQLIRPKQGQPFYVSATVITNAQVRRLNDGDDTADTPQPAADEPYTDITYHQARECVELLSRTSGMSYKLLSQAQVEALKGIDSYSALPAATWIDGALTKDTPEREAQRRFKITLATLWDPSRLLAGNNADGSAAALSNELPQAHYRQLGMMVATVPAAGNIARLQRLQNEIAAATSKENQ